MELELSKQCFSGTMRLRMPREHKKTNFNNIQTLTTFEKLHKTLSIFIEQVTRKKNLICRQNNSESGSNWCATNFIYNHVLHLLEGFSLIVYNRMGIGAQVDRTS
jgi:hypothetical protein